MFHLVLGKSLSSFPGTTKFLDLEEDVRQWVTGGDLVYSRAFHTLVYTGGYVIAIGGSTNGTSCVPQLERLDLTALTWSYHGTDLPLSGRQKHCSLVYNDIVYIIGGNKYAHFSFLSKVIGF